MRLPSLGIAFVVLLTWACEVPRDEGTLVLRLQNLDRGTAVSFHLSLVGVDGRGEQELSLADLGAEDTVKVERVRVGRYEVEFTATDDSGSRVQVGLAPPFEVLSDKTTTQLVTMASLQPGLCEREQTRCDDGEFGPVRSRCLDGQRWLPFELCLAEQHCNGDTCTADPCLPDPCTGHAEACAASGTGFTCSCLPAYTGLACDECAPGFYQWPAGSGTCLDDPCLPDPCNGRAEACTPAGPDFTCTCTESYTGSRCAECSAGFYEWPAGSGTCVDDPCLPDPCNGHASACAAAGAVASCTCLAEYSGQTCSVCAGDRVAYPACLPSSMHAIYTEIPTGDSAPDIWITELDGGDTNLTLTPGIAEVAPVLAPDRTRLAYYRDSEIWLMNLDGSDAHAVFAADVDGYRAVYGLLWRDDDTLLINRRRDNFDFRSERCTLTTGVCTTFLTSSDLAGFGDAEYNLRDVSADGLLIVEGLEEIWQPASDLYLLDLERTPLQFLPLHVDSGVAYDDHSDCRFDPTGTRLAWCHATRAGWPSGDFWIVSRSADLSEALSSHHFLGERLWGIGGWSQDLQWIFVCLNGEIGAVRADGSSTYTRIRGDHTSSSGTCNVVF